MQSTPLYFIGMDGINVFIGNQFDMLSNLII